MLKKQTTQGSDLVEQLAHDYAINMAGAGYSQWQIAQHLRNQGALWADCLPGAAEAYNKLADEIDGGAGK